MALVPLLILAAGCFVPILVHAQGVPVPLDAALVGTWTTKSGSVITGPSFYDPATDRFREPELTGISYSFTADGHYEEAYYRAISNPTSPQYPAGIIQWQHGVVTQYNNNTLVLNPIGIDGRQLLSQPGVYENAILSHYDQPEVMQKYEVLTDTYNQKTRLNLYQWDGTPVNPMWIAYNPPVMLPTTTLLATSTATAANNPKRSVSFPGKAGLPHHAPKVPIRKRASEPEGWRQSNQWLWAGVGFTALGAALIILS